MPSHCAAQLTSWWSCLSSVIHVSSPSRLLLILLLPPPHLPIESTRARSTCWPPKTAQYPDPSLLFSPKRGATMRRSDRRKRGQTTTDFPIRRTPSCRARRASLHHVRFDAMYVHMYVSLSRKKSRAPRVPSARESEENLPIQLVPAKLERKEETLGLVPVCADIVRFTPAP